ncbi:hypothetical protein O0I10_002231 [Lichtheimia ornata]|uniref:Uncharacterized protein n=1 Tax=Lichtheimia ornata TaxID=688661 RepID=A0AAD7VAH9_9FUNG|nr:uncharacterized protein O0I10_002231 [Lichtheimia ornata]KAJ8661900.1 hypothetical protein O0I10_002231 [Lichtheimia ornata]
MQTKLAIVVWSPLDYGTMMMTFYRRFASLLDHLFKNRDINQALRPQVDLSAAGFPSLRLGCSKMLDHFTSSNHHDNNSHANSHINKAVVTSIIIRLSFYLHAYHHHHPWPLLTSLLYHHLVCSLLPNDIWLCSLMNPLGYMPNYRQSKNLRVNASILSHLVYRGVSDTLAMEWIGNSGYLYQLTWIPNEERVYLARLITTMHLPTDPTMLDDAVVLMKALFMFKSRSCTNAKRSKQASNDLHITNIFASLACAEEPTDTDPSSLPDFMLKSNRIRRATIDYRVFERVYSLDFSLSLILRRYISSRLLHPSDTNHILH